MIVIGLSLAGCATAELGGPADARGPTDAPPPPPPVSDAQPIDAMGVIASMCPPDEFATGFDVDGLLQCAPIDATARAAVDEHCSVYLGWRDNCGACTTTPAKWGRTSALSCSNGVGGNNTCSTASLGGVSIDLFGLNTDGDVDENDKFHLGFYCTSAPDEPTTGPCPAGSFMSGVDVKGAQCVTARGVITEYMRSNCTLYFGWRDSCDGCTSAPAKWGRVNSTACTSVIGANGTCIQPTLGGESIHLLGIGTGGNVNGDDKFYVGLQCSGAEARGGAVPGTCPAGELVVGINSDGSVQCASPLPATESVVRDSCYVYMGWRDSCSGCTTAPSKWGRVSHAMCQNGVGADNTCVATPIDGMSIPLLGLNTDGDVDDDDKFHVGLRCL